MFRMKRAHASISKRMRPYVICHMCTAMLKAGLVDEISHITVPVVDGGAGIPTFFDIPGEAPSRAAGTLRLVSHKQLPGSVTWARYRVIGRHTS